LINGFIIVLHFPDRKVDFAADDEAREGHETSFIGFLFTAGRKTNVSPAGLLTCPGS
jgi:hypothetical protein